MVTPVAANLDKKAARRRLAQLTQIRVSLLTALGPGSVVGPRASQALAMGLVACGAVLLSGLSFSPKYGALESSALLAGVAVTILVLRLSRSPQTYLERLYQQLAAYDPIDLNAYRLLQDVTRSSQELAPGEVETWLTVERNAVQLAAGLCKPMANAFLNKVV